MNREPFTAIRQQAQAMTKPLPKPSQSEVKTIGTTIYKEFDNTCKERLGKSFSEVLTPVPEAGLQLKMTPAERKKKNRNQKRKFKKRVEKSWKENDVQLHLAQRSSFATRKRQRLNESFESIDEAEERSQTKKRKRSHGPASIDVELDRLLADVTTWTSVNWSQKAREYKIRKAGSSTSPQNAGQLLKAFLQAQGINTDKFEQQKGG